MAFKVCHITTVHSIDDVRIFHKECISLAAAGFDVTIIACSDIAFEDSINNIRRISLQVPVTNRLLRFFKRSKAVYKKAIEVNSEIYHFHDPELLPVALKLKKRGKKVIFDSHEFYGEQIKHKKYIPFVLRGLIAKLYMKYEAFVCKKLDAVIQICTLNGLDYFNKRATKTIFVTNAPVLEKNATVAFTQNNESVIYMGDLNYYRGITHIIKASANAKVPLILAGNFSPKEYNEQVKQLEEYSNVDYKGFVNQDHINSLLNKSFAGLSTLLHVGQYPIIDTFPTKVYEYMAAGLPVIISNTRFAERMIKKYRFGLCVNPESVEEISKAISFLKNNKEIASQMGENGRKAFEEKFNWQIEEKKLIKLYYSL